MVIKRYTAAIAVLTLGLLADVSAKEESLVSAQHTYQIGRVFDTLSRMERAGAKVDKYGLSSASISFGNKHATIVDKRLADLIGDMKVELKGLEATFYADKESSVVSMDSYKAMKQLDMAVSFRKGVLPCTINDSDDCKVFVIQVSAPRSEDN